MALLSFTINISMQNIALLASGLNSIRPQNSGILPYTRGLFKTISSSSYATTSVDAIAWFNTEGLANPSQLTGNLNITTASTDKNVLIDAMVFDANNNPRGVLPL